MNKTAIYEALRKVSKKDPVSEFIATLLTLQGNLPPETFEDLINILYYYYKKNYSEDQVAKLFSPFEFTKKPEYEALNKETLEGKALEILVIYFGEGAEKLPEKLFGLHLDEETIALPSLDVNSALILDKEKRLVYEVKLTKRGPKSTNIFEGFPIRAGIYYDPLQDDQIYELELLITEPPYRQSLSGPFDKILRKIKYYGTKGKKEAYLQVLFRELLRSGIAEQGLKKPPYGFVFDKSRGEIVNTLNFSDKYDLKEALELLKKHGEEFYKGLYPQFLKTIIVELISPFSFLLRQLQLGVYVPFLFLWGDAGTGKTHLLQTVFHFYPTPDPIDKRKKGPGELHSIYQLGEYLGAGSSKLKMDDTLPILINEGHSVLNNHLDTFKAYFESITLRARYEKEIIGLRHPFFTSNYEPPYSQGLERRMLILYFGRPPLTEEEKERYAQEILPYLEVYEAIGKAFSERFIEVLKKWIAGEITLTQEKLLEVSFDILQGLYEEEELLLPSWLKREYLYTTEEGRDWGQKLLDSLKKILLEFGARYGDTRRDIRESIRQLVMDNIFPFMVYNPNARTWNTILTSSIYEYLAKEGFEHLSFDRIASLFQEKGLVCDVGETYWGYRKYKGVRFNLDDLLVILFPSDLEDGILDRPILDNVVKAEILRVGQYYNLKPPREFIKIVLQNLRTSGYDVSETEVYQALMELVLEGKAEVTPDYVNVLGGS